MVIAIIIVLCVVVSCAYVWCLDHQPIDYDGEALFTLDDEQRDA